VTRSQVVALFVANALLSLVVSLTVVLIAVRSLRATLLESVALPEPTAALAEQPEPTSTELEPTPLAVATYIVKSGDSLSGIAYRHGVSLDALMKANNLTDPDYIMVGQSLVIPGPAVTPEPTPTATAAWPVATILTPGAEKVPIVIESFHRAQRVDDEWIMLRNAGVEGIALEGWVLSDEDGHSYTFPALFLWRGGAVKLHSGPGSNSATDLYWGLDVLVWDRPGEKATLLDREGTLVAVFSAE
jgi:LysM repeat protein